MAKKKNNNDGFGVIELSWVSHWLLCRIALFFIIWIILATTVFKVFIAIGHAMFDKNGFKEGYRNLDDKTDNILNDFIPIDIFPDTNTWGNHIDKLLSFNIDNIFNMMVWIVGSLFILYVITIFIRRHNGEHAPHVNDAEARRLKRRIIRSLRANKRTKYDEDKQVRMTENSARFKLRHMRVEIHTLLEQGQMKPNKNYLVRIKRHQTDDVNNLILKKIKNLDSILTSLTRGVSFGQQETSSDRRFYVFKSSIEVERKEALLVKLRRFRKKRGKGSESESSEYSFPLTLFNDMSEKIETQKAGAEDFGERRAKDVRNYLASIDVQAELIKTFVGNTSVQQTFKLQFTKSPPNPETIAEGLDNALGTSGILAKLDSGNINITIPLPPDNAIPIDVKSMIEEVY